MQQSGFQKKADIMITGYGAILILFYGSIFFSTYLHGDLMLARGEYNLQQKLPDIVLLTHLLTGLFIMFAPFQRRVFGLLAAIFTVAAFTFVIYFYTIERVSDLGSFLFGLMIVFVLLGLPSLYLLFTPATNTPK